MMPLSLIVKCRECTTSNVSKDPDIDVFADPMFGRVFWNLFDNALRHGGEVPENRVFCTSEGGNTVIVAEGNGQDVA